MKATEYEMTVATDAAAQAAFAEAVKGMDAGAEAAPTFDDLTAEHRRRLRQNVMPFAVAAIESLPDRRHAAWLEGKTAGPLAESPYAEEAQP